MHSMLLKDRCGRATMFQGAALGAVRALCRAVHASPQAGSSWHSCAALFTLSVRVCGDDGRSAGAASVGRDDLGGLSHTLLQNDTAMLLQQRMDLSCQHVELVWSAKKNMHFQHHIDMTMHDHAINRKHAAEVMGLGMHN